MADCAGWRFGRGSARRKQRGQAADEEYYYQEQGGSSHKDPYTDLRRIRSFTADPDFA